MRKSGLIGLLLALSLPACDLTCDPGRMRSIEYMNKGVELFRAKAFDSALRELKAATTADPSNDKAHYNLGKTYQEMKKWDDAAASFREASKLKPKITVYRYDLGNALQEGGKLDEALKEYQAAIGVDPRAYKAHYRMGTIYEQQAKPKDADKSYRACIELNPRFVLAYLKLGYLYLEWDYDQEALKVFLNAKTANEGDGAVRNALGSTYMKLKQPDKAIEEFNAAIQGDPDLYDAIYNLGMAYAQVGRKEEAKKWLERATKGGAKLGPDQIKAANDMLMHLARPGQ
jgi:tetratricopeptide (TPR) repeat protein